MNFVAISCNSSWVNVFDLGRFSLWRCAAFIGTFLVASLSVSALHCYRYSHVVLAIHVLQSEPPLEGTTLRGLFRTREYFVSVHDLVVEVVWLRGVEQRIPYIVHNAVDKRWKSGPNVKFHSLLSHGLVVA